MNTLLALLLSSVSLTWVQPPNPGWNAGPTCAANPCLQNYTITDAPANTNYTVPYGAIMPFIVPAAPGVHNYTIVLKGTNAAGTLVSSTPPATASVTVPTPAVNVCPTGTIQSPTGIIAVGGQSKVVTYSCPGALTTDSATWNFASTPLIGIGGLQPVVWVTAGQLNFAVINSTAKAQNLNVSVPITVRCIR